MTMTWERLIGWIDKATGPDDAIDDAFIDLVLATEPDAADHVQGHSFSGSLGDVVRVARVLRPKWAMYGDLVAGPGDRAVIVFGDAALMTSEHVDDELDLIDNGYVGEGATPELAGLQAIAMALADPGGK